MQRINSLPRIYKKEGYMRGFMTLKGYMKASIRLISPFEEFIILHLFFYSAVHVLDSKYLIYYLHFIKYLDKYLAPVM